ncbi:MAG: class I SAM-dependent methyltransferase [Candidatus Krumholzibacteria bacterium]
MLADKAEPQIELSIWEKLQYWLLRPLVHGCNRATEEELNQTAREGPTLDLRAGQQRLAKLIARLEGRLRIQPDLSYLDVGCGSGDLACALIQAGARDVTGIDIVSRNIEAARSTVSQVLRNESSPIFVHADINTWEPAHRYDVVFSHEALEHIDRPDRFIQSLTRLMKPNGCAVLAFGPLFHSPIGDHLWGFFRVQIPWRGLIFSEKVLLQLRREFFRLTDNALRFQDITGGLNLMRYSEFLKYVSEAGLEFEFLSINPQLKRIRPLYHLSRGLVRLPVVQDYFVVSVYAILERERSPRSIPPSSHPP